MEKEKYILDANIFIEAARRYYSFDFGTKFWDFLVEKAKDGILCSIDKVLEEIQQGDATDPLRNWAETLFFQYFYPTNTDEVLEHYTEVINSKHVWNNQYTDNAINEFLQVDNADAWVIAHAKCKNLVIVTHEVLNPQSKKRIPIPNVCDALNINCINVFNMLKKLNFKL